MGNIVYNGLKTPDGTILESRFRWDYQAHTDANGKVYVLDGGLDYVRCSLIEDQILLTVTLDDPHEQVRQVVKWGTYGKEGTDPLSYVKLADMSDEHIRAVLDDNGNVYPQIRQAMKNELKYRKTVDVHN